MSPVKLETEQIPDEALIELAQRQVYVVFAHDEETWRRVVEEADESLCVIDEDSARFEVEYETTEDFARGLERFEGLVEYEILEGPRTNNKKKVKP